MYLACVRVATEAFVPFHMALFSARPKIDALKITFLVVSYQFYLRSINSIVLKQHLSFRKLA